VQGEGGFFEDWIAVELFFNSSHFQHRLWFHHVCESPFDLI